MMRRLPVRISAFTEMPGNRAAGLPSTSRLPGAMVVHRVAQPLAGFDAVDLVGLARRALHAVRIDRRGLSVAVDRHHRAAEQAVLHEWKRVDLERDALAASTKADLAILQHGLDFDPVVQGREHREI